MAEVCYIQIDDLKTWPRGISESDRNDENAMAADTLLPRVLEITPGDGLKENKIVSTIYDALDAANGMLVLSSEERDVLLKRLDAATSSFTGARHQVELIDRIETRLTSATPEPVRSSTKTKED